jgi:murein DD-endopeptidase MepM/ murein hydrolase activator NlpD
MQIIVVSSRLGQTRQLNLAPGNWRLWLPVAAVLVTLGSALYWLGYQAAPVSPSVAYSAGVTSLWQREIDRQRLQINSTREAFDDNINALAYRLGELQAHMARLNAVGQRMVEMARIDPAEFDFDATPALGGPEETADNAGPELQAVVQDMHSLDQFSASLDEFARRLDERERQMRVLQDLLVASRLQEQVRPSGYPVLRGYMTSGYGWRRDPFSGRSAMHRGVDFAARSGADVITVAAGIVTFAGDRNGYGIMVEINHGNGYVTRYGHNSKVLVKPGDRVLKGQRIALVGSTGRSTGPHVHFEVLRNGVVVNPGEYIRAG